MISTVPIGTAMAGASTSTSCVVEPDLEAGLLGRGMQVLGRPVLLFLLLVLLLVLLLLLLLVRRSVHGAQCELFAVLYVPLGQTTHAD